MYRTKAAKVFIAGLSLAMALSAAVYAEKMPEEEITVQLNSTTEQSEAVAPDTPVSDNGQVLMPEDTDGPAVSGFAGKGESGSAGTSEPEDAIIYENGEIYRKQLEADRYLFEDHADEIASRGITITHTFPAEEYVEIGITPYNEENADFIYQALGKDMIKVVEGIQVVAYDIAAPAGESEVYGTESYTGDAEESATADDQNVSVTSGAVPAPAEQTASTPLIAGTAAAAAILLGGILLTGRRLKTAKR